MSVTEYHEPLKVDVIRLSVKENTERLVSLFHERKGHFYIYGWTGTGKSIVSRRIVKVLNARYLNYELLSLSQWREQYEQIASELLTVKEKVIILDGFIPEAVPYQFSRLLRELSSKGIQLMIFTQMLPFENFTNYVKCEVDIINLFNTVAEFKFGEKKSPVEFSLIK